MNTIGVYAHTDEERQYDREQLQLHICGPDVHVNMAMRPSTAFVIGTLILFGTFVAVIINALDRMTFGAFRREA